MLAPAERANTVADALAARLAEVPIGDPRNEATRMGPLVTRAQQAAAFDGIRKLASEAELICGGPSAPELDGIDAAKSAFVAPTLLKVEKADKARAVHDTEVFGPAATIIPYESEKEAFSLIARGGGSLVVSVFGDDRDFLARAVSELGPTHGRVLAVDPLIADAHTGHGIVMPQCHHGGPGRAGNGAEIGRPLRASLLSSARGGSGFDRPPGQLARQGCSTSLIISRVLKNETMSEVSIGVFGLNGAPLTALIAGRINDQAIERLRHYNLA